MTTLSLATPAWRKALHPVLWVAITALFALAPSIGLVNLPNMRQLLLIALLSMVVSGLNLSFGYAGELAFGSAAMYAAGAYATGYMAMHLVNDLLLALVVSVAFGLVIGLVSGIPGLRLGGWMLATSSFLLVMLVPDVTTMFAKQLGGSQGLSGIPIAKLFGFQLTAVGLYVAVIVVTSAWFVLYRNLVVSRTGRAFTVLRESPVLASSLGISVYGIKLKAYAIAGLPAAIAGAFFAYLDGFIAPASFGMDFTIAVLAATILGGRRSIYGIFLGAAVMQLGPMNTTRFGNYAYIAYGILLVAAGVLLPGGIAGAIGEVRARVFGRLRSRQGVVRQQASERPALTGRLPGKRLVVNGVSKRFGGVAALNEVSFTVEPGQIVALIGPNGSGKTTLLNMVSGFYRIDNGSISLGEKLIGNRAAHHVARTGVSRTFQTPIVPEMSVRDAIATARYMTDRAGVIETMLRLPRYRRAVRTDATAVDAVLAACGLADVAELPATSLPLGTRRVLELARSLVADPSLVLLDEIASGLDEEEIEALADVVRAARAAGGTILLVEHNFALVRDLSDKVVVLSQGRLVTEGTPEEIATHPEVLQHYLGEPVGERKPEVVGAPDPDGIAPDTQVNEGVRS